MNHNARKKLAEQTLEVLNRGHYQAASGQIVDLHRFMKPALAGTVLHEAPLATDASHVVRPTALQVTEESTVAAILRLSRENPGHLAALNFASAKNPGGGFLGGAQAQEESLARTSGLYPCLLTQQEFYDRHRRSACLLYQDLAIYAPGVPFFVNDDGVWLEEPALASIITSPAPNAGALANREGARMARVPETLRRRAEFVLQVAIAHQVDTLILGAWGCGVFRNDPAMVADAFSRLLLGAGAYRTAFGRVVFAIYDRSVDRSVLKAFRQKLAA